MAQWAGQFTGRTHLSKVLDREEQLRHAIDVYKSKESGADRNAQAKKVVQLADKLLAARVRALEARLNAMGPLSPNSPIANSMETKIQDVSEGGVQAILKEFNAADVIAD